MEIADSARKHGITDADIWHAIRNTIRAVPQGDDRMFYIGVDRNSRLLELVVLIDDEPAVIHAMPLRRKYFDQL